VGQEISRIHFTDEDFACFEARLAEETGRFRELARGGGLANEDFCLGFEIEAWLVDRHGFPSPTNTEYLEALNSALVVPELSRFNVEINGTPQLLRGHAFGRLESELNDTWHHCLDVAHDLEGGLTLIGILPTIRESDLTMANVSLMRRYAALNEQILRRRGGRPIEIDITGVESLRTTHNDVMLEAATTSFQVHLQIPADEMVRFYNASLIASAPVLALGVNSPFLFGHLLWQETRIPLFEQAVAILPLGADPSNRRVSFGAGYLRENIDEYFIDLLKRYPALLPFVSDAQMETLPHLRLHNGTVWRWNRPLVGFDAAGRPHLRIEHRVLPAGPSILDMLANAAFYTGLATALARETPAPEQELSFAAARDNFYAAARHGLDARIKWRSEANIPVRDLLLEELLPRAREGLHEHKIDSADIDRYFYVLEARVRSGQTGAAWQRRWTETHGRDFLKLSAAYLARQRSGAPVHEWEVRC